MPVRLTGRRKKDAPPLECEGDPPVARGLRLVACDPDAALSLSASTDLGVGHWLVGGLRSKATALDEGATGSAIAIPGRIEMAKGLWAASRSESRAAQRNRLRLSLPDRAAWAPAPVTRGTTRLGPDGTAGVVWIGLEGDGLAAAGWTKSCSPAR